MRGLGTVVGIVIFLLILMAAIGIILIYLGSFQNFGLQLSQAQLSIYNHNNENLVITATAYYYNVSHSDCGIGIGAYHGKAYGIYKYNLSNITITISNIGNVPSTLTYIIISNGSGDQLFIYYIGKTLAPGQSINIVIYPYQLYSPYWPDWQKAPISEYIPYQIVNISCHNQQFTTPYYQIPITTLTQFGNAFTTFLNYFIP
ncbi:hypothetical protein EWF20_08050 [Sulfolobus sp. S-194]|uniref:hypothetical protein n=1 Tax=Sulfolobus sp. S-194 TaxID=2512240 RepID=UPI001436DC18|nr:hypothetical protein [Sulfolobus sp. S-194]QIW24102.1 hypothetical protein EWF20_08050 [Sulfolobus sp. S-194]